MALSWLKSYLSERSQCVFVGDVSSNTTNCTTGVPQGSVLGPVLFAMYTSPLEDIIKQQRAIHSSYADDVNIYSSIDATKINSCASLSAQN